MRWLLILLLAGCAETVWARDWFVAPGGSGDGSSASPFGSVQDGLDAAQPDDEIVVRAGTYPEPLQSMRESVTLRAEPGGEVVVTAPGRVLRVDHADFAVEGIVFDGQYGDRDALDVNDGADGLLLRTVEVRRTSRDCIDMGAPEGVLIEGCKVHHCLNAEGGRTDAHGITGGAVRDLVIRDTQIHTFSGDAVQFDAGREAPGWDRITIEGCRFWLEPLPEAQNGFPAGAVPGENALDTKTDPDGPRALLIITDTVAYGFRGGMISNMAAFNLKEKIDARLDGVTVFDSEIAFRVRGPGSRPGAFVSIANAVVYDVDKAVRYEDDIEQLRIYNSTFGLAVQSPFQRASAPNSTPDVRNLLVLAGSLPPEASAGSNRAVGQDSFMDSAGDDYHLVEGSPPVDQGETISEVTEDRDGVGRPQGDAYDVGAYEFVPNTPVDAGEPQPGDAPEGGTPDSGEDDGGGGDDVGEVDEPTDAGMDPDEPEDGGPVGGCGCGTQPPEGVPILVLILFFFLMVFRALIDTNPHRC